MNPHYKTTHFRAEFPRIDLGGAMPSSFAIVTAWNPNGKTISVAKNESLDSALLAELAPELIHFPVTGGSPDFAHFEPGHGIVMPYADAVELGQRFQQEAIWWIDRGDIFLIDCSNPPANPRRALKPIAPWSIRAQPPADRPVLFFRGNLDLINRSSIAFLCSTQCPGLKILEAYDWATAQCDRKGTVISGFHTPIEHDVLEILARRDAGIIWSPARDIPQIIPQPIKTALAEDRGLILSPFPWGRPKRPTKETCNKRNEFVLRHSTEAYVPHATPGGKLEQLIAETESPIYRALI